MAGKEVELEVLQEGKEDGKEKEEKEEKEEKGKEKPLSLEGQMFYFASKGDVEGMRKCRKEGAKVDVPDSGFADTSDKSKEADPEKVPNHPISGDYPLHAAATGGHVAAAKEIVTWEADLETKNRIGSTPLHRAVSHGQLEVVEFLLSVGASIDAKNKIGNTPLHCAAFCGHIEIAKLLLEANATAHLKTPNNIGFTPLSLAKSGGKSMAQLLVNYRADTSKKLERKSTTGHTGPPKTIEIESPIAVVTRGNRAESLPNFQENPVDPTAGSGVDPKLDQSGSSPTEFHYLKTPRKDSDETPV